MVSRPRLALAASAASKSSSVRTAVTLSEVEAEEPVTGLHASASCASFSSESGESLGSRPKNCGVALSAMLRTAHLRGDAGESRSAESSGAASSQP
jgi:hypothetical protein